VQENLTKKKVQRLVKFTNTCHERNCGHCHPGSGKPVQKKTGNSQSEKVPGANNKATRERPMKPTSAPKGPRLVVDNKEGTKKSGKLGKSWQARL